jgi:hypothetical protein
MKREICRRALFALLAVVLVLGQQPFALSQQKGKATKEKPKAAAVEQKLDEGYTAKIREYTTEPFFLTELVDHLPASDTVPTPEKVLGYIVGTPNKLTYSKDIHRYMREIEKATPRVKTFTIGYSEENRETMLVAVSDEANIQKLDRYKEITAKLADPRKITDAEAKQLMSEGIAFYWASGSIHSPETGSPEMLMELAYRLAVEETPFIQEIRKNAIVLITPVLEVDGRDRSVDLYNYRKANPGKPVPNLLYWGKYVAHDNNRDSMAMSLQLSRIMMKTFLDYHPQVLHDLHESVPFLYTSTGTGPYNAWLDPIVVDEWHLLAYHEIEEMTKRGVPGVWTHGFYDGWAPNYMFYVANGHNSIGRFYETFGGSGADTRDRTVGANQTSRTWFRPNPPLPRVRWSLRNNTNMQQSAILFAMNFVAKNKDRFLNNFYIKSKRSITKATTEGPAAWVIPSDDPRPVECAELVNLLKMQGIEVHTADKEIEATAKEGKVKIPAGSYVIRMDQPYSRMADMLLDTQYFNVTDPRPYDDTGWSLGALRNVKTVRVTDAAILKAPMSVMATIAKVQGKMLGSASTAGYIINHNTDNTLATFRFRLKDIKMSAAEESFKALDKNFNTGSFIIKTEGNPADVRARVEQAASALGLTVYAVDELPKVAMHELAVPRVALVHTWTNTQNEGWFRIAFDSLQIPYDYISVHAIRDTANLRSKYDVIILGPVGGSAQSIVNGISKMGEPMPWKKTDLTPNLGGSPDQTDNMRGGIELEGMLNLKKFIEAGGLFVTVGGNASIPIDYGLAQGVSITQTRELQARGSVFNAVFADRRSPIAYGYSDRLAVYFSQAPVLQVSATGGFGGGGGGGGGAFGGGDQGGRPSGRGTLTDPDIPQGRPPVAPPQQPQVRPGEEPPIPEEFREQAAALLPPAEARPRIVLRFADERDLLVAGMLAGGRELANRPAVVDVPLGQGHILMFANNPIWRHQTQGSFFLLFNAMLNYDHLNVGRQSGRRPGAGEDEDLQDHHK